MVTVMMI